MQRAVEGANRVLHPLQPVARFEIDRRIPASIFNVLRSENHQLGGAEVNTLSGQDRRPILWGLMQGLYYPAVLGTGLWYLVQKMVIATSFQDAMSDLANYFGFLLIVYFSLSFAINQELSPNRYGLAAFGLDIVEIVLLFVAFYHLGLFKQNGPHPADYSRFYLFLTPIPVLQQIWNHAVGYSERVLWWLSGTGVAVLLFGGFLGYAYIWSNLLLLG